MSSRNSTNDGLGHELIAFAILFLIAGIIIGVPIGIKYGTHLHSRCEAIGYVRNQEVVSTFPHNQCLLVGNDAKTYVIKVKGD